MAIGRPGPGTLAALAQMVALARANQRAPGHAGPLDVQNAAGQAGRQYQRGQQFNARLKQRQDEEAATAAHRAAVLQQGTDRTDLMRQRYAMDDERYADQQSRLTADDVAKSVAGNIASQYASTGKMPTDEMMTAGQAFPTGPTTTTGDKGAPASHTLGILGALGPLMQQQAQQNVGRAMATQTGRDVSREAGYDRRARLKGQDDAATAAAKAQATAAKEARDLAGRKKVIAANPHLAAIYGEGKATDEEVLGLPLAVLTAKPGDDRVKPEDVAWARHNNKVHSLGLPDESVRLFTRGMIDKLVARKLEMPPADKTRYDDITSEYTTINDDIENYDMLGIAPDMFRDLDPDLLAAKMDELKLRRGALQYIRSKLLEGSAVDIFRGVEGREAEVIDIAQRVAAGVDATGRPR